MGNKKFTLERTTIVILPDTEETGKLINAYLKDCCVFRSQVLDGRIVLSVNSGYTWDGCSPKFKLFGKWVGTPDTEATYLPSLVHDILYQNLEHPNMKCSREDIDDIFFEMLANNNFKFTLLYYIAVRMFGGVYHRFKSKGNKTVYKQKGKRKAGKDER